MEKLRPVMLQTLKVIDVIEVVDNNSSISEFTICFFSLTAEIF